MNLFFNLKKKYNSISRPAKASMWFISCYVIQRSLQFIGMPIYTRIMTTEEYGIYSVFLSWFTIICVFSSLNIYSGTFNKAMVKYEEQRDSYISSIQWFTLFTSLIISFLFLIEHNFIEEKTGYSLKFISLMCIHIIFFPSLQYWLQKQRFLFEYKKLVFVTLLNSVLSLGLGIIFVLISEEKSFSLILATVLVQAIINGYLFIALSLQGKTFFCKEFWQWTIKVSIPLIPHYLSEILLGHADRIMISKMCGVAEAGIYNIIYQISMIMTIIRQGINGSFIPWLYYALKVKKYDEIRKITRLLALFMSVLTFCFILVGPEIVKIAAPPSYYEAIVGIPPIMIGCYFIFVYVLFMNIEIYYEQNNLASIASIISAIINVLLNYFFIRLYGYIIAAYTTMVSYIFMAVMHYLFMLKITRKNPEIKGIFDNKFILICSLCLMLFGFIAGSLYNVRVR